MSVTDLSERHHVSRQASSDARAVGTQTFVFADLVGFTALTAARGSEVAAEVAIDFHRRVSDIAREHGATVIKTLGDGVMVHVGDPGKAVRLGVRIATEIDRGNLPAVRVGIHTAEAVERAGDWFGDAVNVAAGLVETSCVGEVLVSETTRAAAGQLVGVELKEAGRSRFKDNAEPIGVYSAMPAAEPGVAGAGAPTDSCPPVRPC